jgi:hypothetical protein
VAHDDGRSGQADAHGGERGAGVVYVGLALLLVAFIWWVFRMHRHPEWLFYDAIRVVLLAAVLAGVIVAFIPFVRWIRQLTS